MVVRLSFCKASMGWSSPKYSSYSSLRRSRGFASSAHDCLLTLPFWEGTMIRSRGGEFGVVICEQCQIRHVNSDNVLLTAWRPAFTVCLPVSQTSSSLSTWPRPAMVIASHGYACLEWSIQGIDSARAVRHESSLPRACAAPSLDQPSSSYVKLTRTGQIERILELVGEGGYRCENVLEEARRALEVWC